MWVAVVMLVVGYCRSLASSVAAFLISVGACQRRTVFRWPADRRSDGSAVARHRCTPCVQRLVRREPDHMLARLLRHERSRPPRQILNQIPGRRRLCVERGHGVAKESQGPTYGRVFENCDIAEARAFRADRSRQPF